MHALDISPLFRTAIGFDRLARLVAAQEAAADRCCPPYNIERTGDDAYRLTLAVAGFAPADVEVTAESGTLTVVGRADKPHKDAGRYLHQGISGRAFRRAFSLADHIVVEDARLEHGMLHVDLRRAVPEAMKPRRIPIGTSAAPSLAFPDRAAA